MIPQTIQNHNLVFAEAKSSAEQRTMQQTSQIKPVHA